MAVFTRTQGAERVQYAGDGETPRVFLWQQHVRLAGAGNGVANGDTVEALAVRAGWFVRNVVAEVMAAEGAGLPFDVGDGDDPDAFLSAKNGNALGYSRHAPLFGSAALDPANLIDAAGVTLDIPVVGAKLGDFVSIAPPYDLQGITMTSYVRLADTVAMRLQNESGAAVDLAVGTYKAMVQNGNELYSIARGKLYTADDTIDIKFGAAGAAAWIRLIAAIEDFSRVLQA